MYNFRVRDVNFFNFFFFLRVLFWKGQFPDAIQSPARVVRAWVSKQYTLMHREESCKQILPLIFSCGETAR